MLSALTPKIIVKYNPQKSQIIRPTGERQLPKCSTSGHVPELMVSLCMTTRSNAKRVGVGFFRFSKLKVWKRARARLFRVINVTMARAISAIVRIVQHNIRSMLCVAQRVRTIVGYCCCSK
ncbi:hypothetical protein O6H91_15G056700 [Diphasiastrum complanatum]|uniref:Uncharacterized protein n=1 Tax=Diphasiastrum complanatum TaxID=34168 RepID=A0ACC2BIH0_DIPCM|nr:hypothetical protein O6H91_15G056700 [Diphasiastrum complanatum]